MKEITNKTLVLTLIIASMGLGQIVFARELTQFDNLQIKALYAADSKTWRLDDQGQWKESSGNKEEEFMLRVAEIKKLVDAGKPGQVEKAAKKLKKDYPEIAGEDFNAFIAGEILLAKGKLPKAVKEYDKLLDNYPKSALRDAAMEREFGIATDFLAGRRKQMLLVLFVRAYDDGIKIMEKIADRAGTAEIAKRASYAAVTSFEQRKKYNEAYLKWSEIATRWPTVQTAQEALLGMARNKYATYHGPEYDGSGLVSAKTYYENFKLRYPQEAQSIKVDDILKRIDEQLAEKNLLIAKYYARTGAKEPANMYNQMTSETWPNTPAGQKAKEAVSKKN
jgi:outer membrane protein assembly factor BamD (BamD/ComL family)